MYIVNKKINSIARFFSLLFTDKDMVNDESTIVVPEEHTEPEHMDWMNAEEVETTTPEEKIYRIAPDAIWPESEDIIAQVIPEEPVVEIPTETHNIEEPIPLEERVEEPAVLEESIAPEVPEPVSATPLVSAPPAPQKSEVPEIATISTEKIILGVTTDTMNTVTLDTQALKRHMLVVGMTGSGKTTMLERMILQDIEAGRGVGLIDPHGDLYDKILKQIPKSRTNDVVLFDLTDVEYPIGFNILENTHHQFPSLIASSIVGVFKKIFGYSWGPRLEYILRNATLTLLEHEWSTLLDLTLLLSDEDFRKQYLSRIKNPFLKKFWYDEFDNLSTSRQAEVVSPILNKVGQFLSVPLMRNIVSQPQSGFSPRWIMDNKKIFLANLSKGKIGEDVSEMLGSLLVSKFQLDVMSRANIAPEDRTQYTLYVDEFQNFATESFADIFSEARKYGLGLVIAHQYMGQVNAALMDAILGNVGNIALFHLGSNDAKLLAPNMGSWVLPTDLTEQPLYTFTLKTAIGEKKKVMTGELISPDFMAPRSGVQSPEKLQTLVREKFAKSREFVEGKLNTKME